LVIPDCPAAEATGPGSLGARPDAPATEEGPVEESTLARTWGAETLVPGGVPRFIGAPVVSPGLAPSTARVVDRAVLGLGTPAVVAIAGPGEAGPWES
jgi:hypothetical protein